MLFIALGSFSRWMMYELLLERLLSVGQMHHVRIQLLAREPCSGHLRFVYQPALHTDAVTGAFRLLSVIDLPDVPGSSPSPSSPRADVSSEIVSDRSGRRELAPPAEHRHPLSLFPVPKLDVLLSSS